MSEHEWSDEQVDSIFAAKSQDELESAGLPVNRPRCAHCGEPKPTARHTRCTACAEVFQHNYDIIYTHVRKMLGLERLDAQLRREVTARATRAMLKERAQGRRTGSATNMDEVNALLNQE